MPGFLQRPCPGCGADRAAAEVRSDPPAETLTPDELRPFWEGFHARKLFFSYHRCGGCGLLFAPRFFGAEQLGRLYANLAPNMDMVPSAAIAATQRGYFDAAARAAGGAAALAGGYLEIGPDVGHVAGHAARDGRFDAFWLFEPNRAVHGQLAAAVAPHPPHLFAGMADLSPVPDGTVGLAVMVQVLDHLLDPADTLRQVRAKLRPGGMLMIVTHNEASLLRRAMGRRWPPFCLQHPQVFSPASIAAMLGRAGYGQVDVQRSTNYFPIDFLVRQAGLAVGLKLGALPVPGVAIGLRLGNMLTLARA